MNNGTLLAAVDMGSNSFRLEIGRYDHGHIQRVEYLKEMVRQGGGGTGRKVLQSVEVKLVVVLGQAEGRVVVEVPDAVQGEFAGMAAQRPSGRARQFPQVVEREPAAGVLRE